MMVMVDDDDDSGGGGNNTEGNNSLDSVQDGVPQGRTAPVLAARVDKSARAARRGRQNSRLQAKEGGALVGQFLRGEVQNAQRGHVRDENVCVIRDETPSTFETSFRLGEPCGARQEPAERDRGLILFRCYVLLFGLFVCLLFQTAN